MRKEILQVTDIIRLPLGRLLPLRNFALFFVIVLFSPPLSAQYKITGTVYTMNGSVLADAAVRYNHTITLSNTQGFYQTTLLGKGEVSLSVSYTGYTTIDTLVNVNGPLVLDFTLRPYVTNLDEVVVNRENSGEREIKNSAVPTQTVDDSYIRQNLGGSLMQTLEKLGGVNTIAIGSGQSKPIIRGLSFNRVVVTENGIKHEGQQWGADHGLEIDQYAVGSLRLIKGPQSLAYGSDAIAGVIEIERPKPPLEDVLGGSVDMTYKSNNALYGSSLNVFGRKKSIFFDARLTALDYADYKVPVDYVNIYSYRAPLYHNQLRNTAGNELNLHLNTGWVGDAFSSVFYLSNLKSRSGLFANAHGLEPRNVDTDLYDASDRDIHNPYQDVNHFKIINRTRFSISNHKLEAEAGYQNNYRQEFSDYISHGFMPANYPNDLGIDPNLERGFKKEVFSLNAKDNFRLGRHSVTVGITGEHQDNTISGWGFIIPDFRQWSAGVYLLEKWQFKERWFFHAGLRYDYGHLRTGSYFDWFESPLNGQETYLQRSVALTREFNSPSWAIGVNYNREHLFLRANLGRSFRMPIAKELASNGVNYHHFSYEIGDRALAAEKSYQLDLGMTYSKNGLLADVSPFLNYFSNYIYLNPTPEYDYAYGAGNQVYRYTQTKVFRYGGEARITCNFLKHFTAGATGELVYSEQLTGPKKGYSLPFSPAPSVLFHLGYTGSFNGLFKKLTAGIDYKLVGDQNIIVPPENKTPGYTTINLLFGTDIRWQGQLLQFSLQVQNLLNSTNFNHTSFYRIIGVPEPGRNIVASLKLPFVL